MKILCTLAFIILFTGHGFAQAPLRTMEGLSMHSAILGADIRYSICLPEGYSSGTKKYPVVFLLHGLGDNEASWLEYGRVDSFADRETTAHAIVPAIYVMPQGFKTYYANDFAGTYRYEDMFVQELVPFIDKTYRTVADAQHRATVGYSMGGFGALMLVLKHPDVFSITVPMSISMRTDQQYETEAASGWDEQWGRIFGGSGLTGEARLTDYYLKNSPFHVNYEILKGVHVFILNGDDEGTLSRSNEELHELMRDQHFAHEYRVRNGGHEFAFWRESMVDGFRFISDSFEGKPYRGDVVEGTLKASRTARFEKTDNALVVTPKEYNTASRQYPVIFITGETDEAAIQRITGKIDAMIEAGAVGPVITAFVKAPATLEKTIQEVELAYRVRAGFRFRAFIGFGAGAREAMQLALTPETTTACSLIDGDPDCSTLQNRIKEKDRTLSRTWFYITTPANGAYYKDNGCVHSFLREADVYHEYRVAEGSGGAEWRLNQLEAVLRFTEKKIHH